MNPYVYSKRRTASSHKQQDGGQKGPMGGSLLKAIINAPISPAIAIAFVIFAAGATASMSAVAFAEIGGASELPVAHTLAMTPQPYVLGDSTTVIDDSALEASITLPSVKLIPKAKSFDQAAGRWDYLIYYSGKNLTGSGSITIGTYVVANNIASSTGSAETGSILKPATLYHVTFWVTDSSGNKIAAARAEIKTGKGKISGHEDMMFYPCLNPGQASSTTQGLPPGQQSSASSTVWSMMCLKTKEGSVLCPRPPACGLNRTDGEHNTSTILPNFPPKPPKGDGPSSTLNHLPPPPPNPQGSSTSGDH